MTENRLPRQVTIKDIATELNMAHSTVSRALNDRATVSVKTKAIVRAKAAELGYVPNLSARILRGDSDSLIGLVVPDILNDFYNNVSKELTERCRRNGRRLLLAVTEDDAETEKNEIRALLEARVSGIVVTLTSEPCPETLAYLNEIPTVQLVRKTRKLKTGTVVMDDAAGTEAATLHLLAQGHRNIAYLGGTTDITPGADRLEGFLRAHKSSGVLVKKDAIELDPPRQQFGFDGMNRLLSGKRRPTAVLVGSSELTIGALRAIQQATLAIPSDISVIGYGDPVWFSLLTPGLSALRLPFQSLAAEAASALFFQIENNETVRTPAVVVQPELILRGSTAPPLQA